MAVKSSVSVNGFNTEYIRFGNGGKILVILPGLSVQSVLSSADAIEKQYSVFTDDFTVYLFDRRSELPESYSIFEMAEDTFSAIKALGLEDINLFGVSQGGMIALTLTAKHPELVKKLALGSAAVRICEQSERVIGRWIELALSKNAKELYLDFARMLYPENVFEQYKGFFDETAKSVTDEELGRFSVLASAAKGFDIRDRIKSINCPVLALSDRTDCVLGVNAGKEIAECFGNKPDFESYTYDGYGHAVYDTAPDFTDRLYRFF